RLIDEYLKGTFAQPPHSLDRIEAGQRDIALASSQGLIGAFKHPDIEILLTAEVVIKEVLADICTPYDRVDPRTVVPFAREFGLGGSQDPFLRTDRVSLHGR